MPEAMKTNDREGAQHASYTSPINSPKGTDLFNEETILKRFLAALPLPDDHAFLNVVRGYGRKMEWLRDLGIKATGEPPLSSHGWRCQAGGASRANYPADLAIKRPFNEGKSP